MERRGGGSILTLTYLGSQRVFTNYNVMGVAKAALEAAVRYLAADLGPQNIRVNADLGRPDQDAGGVGHRRIFEHLQVYRDRAPLRRSVETAEVADAALFLLGDAGAIPARSSWWMRASTSWACDPKTCPHAGHADRASRDGLRRTAAPARNPGWLDDATITVRVKTALLNDPGIGALKIDVATEQGVVTLSGTVRNKEEEAAAIALTKSVDGVRDVKSTLKTQP